MEQIAKDITLWVGHAVEILAALIIGVAVLQVLWRYTQSLFKGVGVISREAIRIEFGSNVAVALELMLGADVLATAVAPSWSELGKLAAIAVIRTALNYFLERELRHIKEVSILAKMEESNQQRA
jgi:uncharacterized membrane protein